MSDGTETEKRKAEEDARSTGNNKKPRNEIETLSPLQAYLQDGDDIGAMTRLATELFTLDELAHQAETGEEHDSSDDDIQEGGKAAAKAKYYLESWGFDFNVSEPDNASGGGGGGGGDTEPRPYEQRGPQGDPNMKGNQEYDAGKSVFGLKLEWSQADNSLAQIAKKPPPKANTRMMHTPLTAKLLCMWCLELAQVDKQWLQLSAYFLTRKFIPAYKQKVMIPGKPNGKEIDAFDFFKELHTRHIPQEVRTLSHGNLALNTMNTSQLLIEIAFAVVIPCLYMEVKESDLPAKQVTRVRERLNRMFGQEKGRNNAFLQDRCSKINTDELKHSSDERKQEAQYLTSAHQRLHAIALANCAKLVYITNAFSYQIIQEVCKVLQGGDTDNPDKIDKLITMSAQTLFTKGQKALKWQDIALLEILYADIMLLFESVSRTPKCDDLLKHILKTYFVFNAQSLFRFRTDSIETKRVLIDIVQDFHKVLQANIDYDHIIVIRQPKPNTPPGPVIAAEPAAPLGAVTDFQKLPVTMLRLRIT